MKRRIAIAGSLTILIFIMMPIALILLNLRGQGIFMISAIVTLVYVGIYVFGGVPKLIIAGIYGVITFIFLLLLKEPYHLPILIMGTLLFVLNPLSSFEEYLTSKMNDEDVLPIRISLRGSYWPFFSYQKEMKNFYHLPQARKLYTKKWYLHLRQIVMLTLITLGIFLFLNGINQIANTLDNFSWFNFFVFYNVIMLFVLAWMLFKKGFTSTFRTFVLALFLPMIYLVFRSDFPDVLKFSLAGSLLLIGLIVSVVELIKYYQRVVYDSYHYYDPDLQMEVYANALFEPLVYNESYILTTKSTIRVNLDQFHKQFKDILVYANWFKIIITAYTATKDTVYLYADFHMKDHKRAEKFKTYLEAKFKMEVFMDLSEDQNKEMYEETFFHRPEYIIARAQSLAGLLKELEIKTKIIISMIVYFELEEELEAFTEDYAITRMEELSDEAYLTARVDLPSINVDYMIESKIREVLLSLLVHHGHFVRISVYY
ncbi:MAG: hypothetical protein A2Y45_01035 [Tenericutes bacterium GWC2_34_14]|nr:MAG: hypothetical protein A2Z84_01480 [Tenericutes bacterium GWA2_35_7]OHE29481.1 MAG: hypothetical protein A2Y45_01035 [Tenericutes bacterium GWC2_34_14]OHE34577.1 MAG: hypothetical protein A2012_08655 [Tenericutes bacterium GWE2_34_108]OHE35934.1 MAG: hypothetical protein A2Y46_03360 [Tenericutes bacterium GWF1_35_14]OHE38980.1 MAG: hypothetical protein A2Y44_06570 [Tenericutes bacterium GWF2_35_184]OHE42953.1 MAG: hypothetical protein A2221_09665 [Tenericutes bacterium RIFOXYA2_FULL_36_3